MMRRILTSRLARPSSRLFFSTQPLQSRFRVDDETRLKAFLIQQLIHRMPFIEVDHLRITDIFLDIAGSAGDPFCNAPLASFIEAFFNCYGYILSQEDAQGPMGIDKLGHIRQLFEKLKDDPQWKEKYGARSFTEEDVQRVYKEYRRVIISNIEKFTLPIEGMPETIAKLRKQGVSVKLNSAYSRPEAEAAVKALARGGLHFSFEKNEVITMDDIPRHTGRPNPGLLKGLQAWSGYPHPASIISIFDGIPDLNATLNFGAWAVAQAGYSTNVGITQAQAKLMTQAELRLHQNKAINLFKKHGPNYITMKPDDIFEVMDDANCRLSRGEFPLYFPSVSYKNCRELAMS